MGDFAFLLRVGVMPNNPLFRPLPQQQVTASLQDQIQIALAIADATMLRSLLVNCIPPITPPHLVGDVSVELEVPAGDTRSADAILHFEAIKCTLAPNFHPPVDSCSNGGWSRESKEFARITKYETDTRTLGDHLAMAPAVSLLLNSGFCPRQVEEILHLPHEGWYKSWWHTLDGGGNFSLPFLRYIRTLRYPNGKFTIQYKDFFEQDEPLCFRSQPQRVLVSIKPELHHFGETLRQINQLRSHLQIDRALLICDTLSELEAQGFISQGISVYPAVELVLPSQANCTVCCRHECPMNGREESAIALCYGFIPETELF